MCISKLGQMVYGALAFIAVTLVLASMFTSGWREMTKKVNDGESVEEIVNFGLFQFTCFDNSKDGLEHCKKWWQNQPQWEQIVVVLMVLGMLFTVVAFVWNLLTFCACFCKGSILKPLPGLASAAACLIGFAVVLYYVKNKDYIEELKKTAIDPFTWQNVDDHNDVSYSFYLACGACLASAANIVVGTLTVCMADQCL